MDYHKLIHDSINQIKGGVEYSPSVPLVSGYGFESIDIIDLFFEIQQRCGTEIDINEIAAFMGGTQGRRFNDITPEDIRRYLERLAPNARP